MPLATATPPSAAPGRGAHGRPLHRPAPVPRRVVGDLAAAAFGLGLGAVVAEVVHGETIGTLRAPGGLATAAGRFTGFTGSYLLLVMVLLAARLPALERAVGQDRLLRWHRRSAPFAVALICAHVVLVTVGYAALSKTGPVAQLWTFVSAYPDMLAAAVGFALLVMAAATSVRIARRKLRYETWWVVHLYTYIGLALAFTHQIVTGVSFLDHPLTQKIWIGAWSAAAAGVVAFRVGHPLRQNLRHRLRVVAVNPEAPGVASVICAGRNLERLAVSGGQFFQWRFLTRHHWWQAHPYSLSALPRPPYLRVTIKAVGDHSVAVAALKPGTRVLIEGPYGAFTHHARRGAKVALVGAGAGVTPVRALLEELPAGSDAVVILRASSAAELVHRDEVAALVDGLGGRLVELVGPRDAVRLDADALHRAIPDLARRDLYVCGPDSFSDGIVASARHLGLDPRRIHREEFAF